MIWEKIPFIYFKYNSDEKPLIYYIKSLIDEIESMKSKMDDIIKDSIDGVNVVKNYGDKVEKFVKNLNTFGTVFVDQDGDYKKESTNVNVEAFKAAIEQLRKDIYDIGHGVDTESDKFGNQQSGVALELLFSDLDLDCNNIETEFQSSLTHFLFFYNTAMALNGNSLKEDIETEFIFNKSLITNENEKITSVKNSIGVVSNKTALANHPFVTNVEEELKQIEKEEKEKAEKAEQYVFNSDNDNNEEEEDADEQ